MVEADLKSWSNDEHRHNHVVALNKPEYLKIRSVISKKLWENQIFREKTTNGTKKALRKKEVREKMSRTHTGMRLSIESREKVSKANKGKRHPWMEGNKNPSKTPEARKKISDALIGRKHPWAEGDKNPLRQPDIREKHRRLMNSPEIREKCSSKAIRLWQDPIFQRKIAESRKRKPNHLEIAFMQFLESICPSAWEYVGDFKFFIGTKNPDYKHRTEMKLIELFGDYWHKRDNSQEKIDHYKKHGYSCLIIWQSEFENEREEVKRKVLSFSAPLSCFALH